MGLDVSLTVSTPEKLYHAANEQGLDSLATRLSRTFCNFLCRGEVVDHESELKQLARITGVDTQPIELMSGFNDRYTLEEQLSFLRTEEERALFLNRAEENNQKVTGNTDLILSTLTALIEALSATEDLNSKLIPTDFDSLNNEVYFANFNENPGDGYIGNNFGQDLRNLLTLVKLAKSIGEETVYFSYG